MSEKKINNTSSLPAARSLSSKCKEGSILLVESSSLLTKAITRKIRKQTSHPLVVTANPTEALEIIDDNPGLLAAIVDCEFPGEGHDQVINLLVEKGIAVIAMTSERSGGDYEDLWVKGVFDIISNDDPRCTGLVLKSLGRLRRNANTKILVVDDSSMFRSFLSNLLKNQRFMIFEAKDGASGLNMLKKHPDVRIVVTDYDMPVMDGFELTREIRKAHCEDELAILGLSGKEISFLGARFLKHGANDFILKQNFVREEFYYRVNLWADNLQLVHDLKKSGITDIQTGMYTRDYLHDYGIKFVSQKNRQSWACAVIEIDYLTMLNEGFGYVVGNQVIKKTAETIKCCFGCDAEYVLARIGHPRFCILFKTANIDRVIEQLERVREEVVNTNYIQGRNEEFDVTVSIGCRISNNLDFAEFLDEALELQDLVVKASGNAVIVLGPDAHRISKELPVRISQLLSARVAVQEELPGRKISSKKCKRVLLVDDSPIIKKIVAGFLQRLGGIEYEKASNGKEALETLRKENFDLVFFDITMPIMNGIKAAAIAKKEFPGLLIVMLTAEQTMVDEAEKIGVDGFMAKPFNFKMIRTCLEGLGML